MTANTRDHIFGCAKLLRHSFQLVVVLTLSKFVHPFYILDITQGRPFTAKTGPAHHSPSSIRENWEPNAFWWRSKRSALRASTLSPRSSSSPLPTQYLDLQSPASFSDFQSLSETSTNKLLKKMRQISKIKAALRRRDKLRRLGKVNLLTQQAVVGVSPFPKIEEGSIPIKTSKTRRTKMIVASRRMEAQADPKRLLQNVNDWFPGKDGLSKAVQPEYAVYGPGTFAASFSPEDGVLEMFPNKGRVHGGAGSNMGSFDTSPRLFQYDGLPSSESSTFFSSSGSNPQSGFKDSYEDPLSIYDNPPGQPGFPEFTSEDGSFTQFGAFSDDNKDCPTIATKSCASDADCSCHGFYSCVRGRCDIVQQMIPGEQFGPPSGTWHDKPVDFGLSKRSSGPEVVHGTHSSGGQVQKQSVDTSELKRASDTAVKEKLTASSTSQLTSLQNVQKMYTVNKMPSIPDGDEVQKISTDTEASPLSSGLAVQNSSTEHGDADISSTGHVRKRSADPEVSENTDGAMVQ